MKIKEGIHTFVVCAYKDSPYLEECIMSLKSQTVASKIIMITSTPSEYIEGVSKKCEVPLYINEGEGGIAQDWNFGISKCNSRYVTIAHQDDTYESEYLETIMRKLQSKPKALIAFSDYGEIRKGIKVNKSKLLRIKRILLCPMKIERLQDKRIFKKLILMFGNPICCPSVTYNMDRLSTPIFEIKYGSNLDWQTWVELSLKRGDFVYCDSILMHHRIHQDSATSGLIENSGRSKEDFEMFTKLWPKPIAKVIGKIYKNGESLNE